MGDQDDHYSLPPGLVEYSWRREEGIVYLVQAAEYKSIVLSVETSTSSGAVRAAFVVGAGGEEVKRCPLLVKDVIHYRVVKFPLMIGDESSA